MTPTRLVFVATPQDASPPRSYTTYVVLDTAWTPVPDDRGDVIPVRPLAGEALRRADLFEEALSRLDAWGRDVRIVDRLTVHDVTYWYRLREMAWHWLHERLIWERVIAGTAGSTTPTTIVVPEQETALLEVAAAVGRERGIDIVVQLAAPAMDADSARVAGGPETARVDLARLRDRLRRLVGGAPHRAPRSGRAAAPHAGSGRGDPATVAQRADFLADRVRTLGAQSPDPILVLTNTRLQQRIGDPEARRVEDPNLGTVIARLRQVGLDPVVMGLGLDQSRDADWQIIESHPRLLPQSVLRKWRRPEESDPTATDLIRDRVRSAASVPLVVHGVDLAPALTAWMGEQAAIVVGTILRQVPRIGGLVDELRPRAIVLTYEGIQTQWLKVARDRSIPTFAVQHGMLYATHPGYCHPRDPRLLLPDATFVTGPFERDVLLQHGGYEPDEVVVVGSPRLEMDDPKDADPLPAREREATRRELGVTGNSRMLVISTGFLPLHRRFVLAATLERLFGQPVPGVHVVFKQHPGEEDEGPYRQLLGGLARAGGFAPPPISVVRDVDLYRLLRAADAHLGLHSTVLTDAVAVRTPNLIAVDQAHADLLGYVAAGVARPVRDANDLRAALEDLRPPDQAARQAFLAAHVEAGPASERIVAHITAALGASR